jgi:hypothetical protein
MAALPPRWTEIVVKGLIAILLNWLWLGFYEDPGYPPLQKIAGTLALESVFLQWYLRYNHPEIASRFGGAFVGAWAAGPFFYLPTAIPDSIVILLAVVPPVIVQALWMWQNSRAEARRAMLQAPPAPPHHDAADNAQYAAGEPGAPIDVNGIARLLSGIRSRK